MSNLTLKDFVSDVQHFVIQHNEDRGIMKEAMRQHAKTHYGHVYDQCLEYLKEQLGFSFIDRPSSAKISYEESAEVISSAQRTKRRYPGMRFGQALWDNLPDRITNWDLDNNVSHHLFYEKDDTLAGMYFTNEYLKE